jgi:hypothetical protein
MTQPARPRDFLDKLRARAERVDQVVGENAKLRRELAEARERIRQLARERVEMVGD